MEDKEKKKKKNNIHNVYHNQRQYMGQHKCIIQTSTMLSISQMLVKYGPQNQNAPIIVDDVSTP